MSKKKSREANTFTPNEAKTCLENSGYAPDIWDYLMNEGGSYGMHTIKALITIARGGVRVSLTR